MSTVLRDHIQKLHPGIKHLPRSNVDTAMAHARDHHRHITSHDHEDDNAGAFVGPNTNRRRPSGWNTGEGVIMRRTSGPLTQPGEHPVCLDDPNGEWTPEPV